LHCSGLALPLFAFSGLAHPFFAFSGLIRLIFSTYFYTGTSSCSTPAACCDDFFPASYHIRTWRWSHPALVLGKTSLF
jgi:hypothetical protein